VPKTVIFQELPKTSTGKVQKFVLRASRPNPPDSDTMFSVTVIVNPLRCSAS